MTKVKEGLGERARIRIMDDHHFLHMLFLDLLCANDTTVLLSNFAFPFAFS